MSSRKLGSAEPMDGASKPAEADEAAPLAVRPTRRHDPPAREIARAIELAMIPSPITRTSVPLRGVWEELLAAMVMEARRD